MLGREALSAQYTWHPSLTDPMLYLPSSLPHTQPHTLQSHLPDLPCMRLLEQIASCLRYGWFCIFGGNAWRNRTGRRIKSTSFFFYILSLLIHICLGGKKVFKNPPGISHMEMMWSHSTFQHFHYLIIIIVPDGSIHSFIILEGKYLMWGQVQAVWPWELQKCRGQSYCR